MLRLNPNDNQGVRYTLAGWLLVLDRDDDLARLLRAVTDEGSAAWAYTKALLAFRRQGDTPEARKLLKEARKVEQARPGLPAGRGAAAAGAARLLQPRRRERGADLRRRLPGRLEVHAGGHRLAAEALAARKTKKPKASRRPPGRPASSRSGCKHLPQAFDVWQADCRPLPTSIEDEGELVQPWMTLVTSRSNDLVLAHEMPWSRPRPALLWDAAGPGDAAADGRASRTGPPSCRSGPTDAGTSCGPTWTRSASSAWRPRTWTRSTSLFDDLSEHLRGKSRRACSTMPGVTPEQVGRLLRGGGRVLPAGPVEDSSATRRRSGSSATGSRAAPGTPW